MSKGNRSTNTAVNNNARSRSCYICFDRSAIGEDNQITMAALGTRAASEGYLDMWDAGARDDLTIHTIAVRKQQPLSFMSLGSLSDAGLSQCRAGHYAEGEVNARHAFKASARAFGPRTGITGGAAYSLAVCLIGLNKLPEASELLRNIDSNAVEQLSGDLTVRCFGSRPDCRPPRRLCAGPTLSHNRGAHL